MRNESKATKMHVRTLFTHQGCELFLCWMRYLLHTVKISLLSFCVSHSVMATDTAFLSVLYIIKYNLNYLVKFRLSTKHSINAWILASSNICAVSTSPRLLCHYNSDDSEWGVRKDVQLHIYRALPPHRNDRHRWLQG